MSEVVASGRRDQSLTQMRRVVTGTDQNGRSVFVADGDVGSVHLWASDEVVALPADGTPPVYETVFPPAAGFRVLVATFGPEPNLAARVAADQAWLADPLFMAHASVDGDGSGMHTTQTVDIGLVLDGEIHLELDDGAEVLLSAGDSFVQNGTRHAWHNRSDRDCTVHFTIIGADQARDHDR